MNGWTYELWHEESDSEESAIFRCLPLFYIDAILRKTRIPGLATAVHGEDKNFHCSFTTEISNKKDESIQNFILFSLFFDFFDSDGFRWSQELKRTCSATISGK